MPLDQTPACRVLVVDDNRDTTDTTAILLKAWGHDVRVAHDGPQAIEAAQDYRPHVILQDIGVPGLSGLEVANLLRQDPTFGQTLLVAITGFGSDEDRRRSQLAGFDKHWLKPVDPTALQALLASPEMLKQESLPVG